MQRWYCALCGGSNQAKQRIGYYSFPTLNNMLCVAVAWIMAGVHAVFSNIIITLRIHRRKFFPPWRIKRKIKDDFFAPTFLFFLHACLPFPFPYYIRRQALSSVQTTAASFTSLPSLYLSLKISCFGMHYVHT